ncbi:MAG: alpha/beta fold hydrolase [Caulobacteraceae bacterium]
MSTLRWMRDRHSDRARAFNAQAAPRIGDALAPALALLVSLCLAGAAAPRAKTSEPAVCGRAHVTCGQILRSIDPSGRIKGDIPIAYAIFRHWREGAGRGTIVAQEGGPGLSSVRSYSSYHTLYAPLLADHDLVVVDARGTGNSDAVDCQPMQSAHEITVANVGACGRSLGDTADFYGTGLAVEDMIAVLDHLGVRRFDYYGDSYGTFFGQTLAARYPDRVQSMVLDGAYPVIGENPWYPHAGEALRRTIDLTCERSAYCAALPGSSLARVERMIDRLGASGVSGVAPDANGVPRFVVADAKTVGLTLYIGLSGWPTFRDLDAAARAFETGDNAPLLRLVAENETGEVGSVGPAHAYSRGLFTAAVCMDSPTVYDMRASPAERLSQRDAAVAAKRASDPDIYRPLSIAQFLSVPVDISYIDLCLQWPIDHPPYPPARPIPAGDRFSGAPTLIINGELDMLTPVADGAVVTQQFPNGRQVVIANSFHVDALGDIDDCTSEIVRRFTATHTLDDTGCAAKVKAIRLTPFFPRRAAEAIPATPLVGNAASSRERALASAALRTAADSMARWYINYSGKGLGLRGGAWRYLQQGTMVHFGFTGSRWAPDLAISGSAHWNQATGAMGVDLTFVTDAGDSGAITASWNDRDDSQPASLAGKVDGHALRASMPSP